MRPIILASKSPRRIELMRLIAPDVLVRPSHFDESQIHESNPALLVRRLAYEKASAVGAENAAIVIGCDTVVALGHEIFGKPRDKMDEIRMLRALSGNTHSVLTGVCLLIDGERRSFECESQVTFFPLTEAEMEEYASSEEPYDKAGGYGIQGKGGLFVERISGDYNNVVGLPVGQLNRILRPILDGPIF